MSSGRARCPRPRRRTPSTTSPKPKSWNLPIILIVLLAVFGSLAAAAIPLALGICTVVLTMALVYLLSMFTTMSVFVTSTVSMFGIALAVDYSLFILMRFREELRAGRQPNEEWTRRWRLPGSRWCCPG